jgi:MFS family permease
VVIWLQVVMMLQAFVLALLTFTGLITVWYIIGLSFVLGTASAFEMTARQAMLTDMVKHEAIPSAIALNSAIFNGARVVGPVVSTPFLLLLHDQGIGWAFFANGVSYLFVILSLLFIKTQGPNKNVPHSLMSDFIEGQKFIRATPIIFLLILIVTIPSFFGFPFGQFMPVFASDVLHGIQDTAATVDARNSFLLTAQGIGALIAAVFLAYFSSLHRKGLFLVIGQIAFAVALIGFSFATEPNIAYFLLIIIGWGIVTQLALTNTLIQLAVPNELRGRVIGTYFWAQSAVAPFGSLFIGYLAQQFNVPIAVRVGGIICLVGYLAVHFLKPTIRKAVV